MFHLTQKSSKGLRAFFALFVVTASLFSAVLISTSSVHAADPTPQSGGCVGSGVSTGLKSPFSKTSNMCLGDDATAGRRFYQFAIKLDAAVDVSVSAKSGSGTSISFVKQSDALYVSKPDSNSMGYAAYTIATSPACNANDKNNIITIATKGPGSNNTDSKEINLCSYKGNSSQSLIYYTAPIKDASGTTTATTGTIKGNLGVQRNESIVPDNHKQAKLNKDYVTSFVLSGPTNINGRNNLPSSSEKGNGFDLTNGNLTIEGLKPGAYTLKIVYNDLAAISAEGGDPGWTKETTFNFNSPKTLVTAGKTSWLGDSTATNVFYASTTVENGSQTSAEDIPSSCTIEGIGWIVCPVINFLAAVADGSFKFLADNFLRTDPNVFNTESGTYKAWAVMRNIANILFVIAFLFIVFSQLTGVGISNYGVKKMLPRIVVAAILVNLSYFISQLAIDISNILGYSIRNVFDAITHQVVDAQGGSSAADASVLAGGDKGFVALAGVVLAIGATGAAIYLLLSAFAPILLAAVLALVLILFILIARQAIVILLVVLSPIAFVAFLLPNTESLFKQWRKILTAMLLLFPIIALVFGTSTLASVLLQGSFTGVASKEDDPSNIFGQIISAGVLILPLFAVPVLLKKSLDGVPALGQMANRWSSRANSGLSSKIKDGNKNSYVGRGNAIRKQGRQAYSDRKFAENVSKGGIRGFVPGLAAKGIGITPKGRYARNTVGRVADEASEKAFENDIGAMAVSLKNTHINPDTQIDDVALELSNAIIKGDKVKARAAQSILLNSGGAGLDTLHKTLDASSTANPSMRNSEVGVSLRNALNNAGLKGKDNALASYAYSNQSLQSLREDSGTFKGLSSVELAGQRKHVLEDAAAKGAISKEQASAVLADNVSKDMDPSKKALFQTIASSGGTGSNPTVPQSGTQTSSGSAGAAPAQQNPQGTVNVQGGATDSGTINVNPTGAGNNTGPVGGTSGAGGPNNGTPGPTGP